MTIRSIDLSFRRRDYRIREPEREAGASVRMGDYTTCAGCFRTIAPATKRLVDGQKLSPHCLTCALAVGLLIETPESIARREAEEAERQAARAARMAGVGS